MTGKDNRDFESHVAGFYHKCEWFALRTVVFGVFLYELGRYIRWLVR